MAWKHVSRADVNTVDIFAFINLKKSVQYVGRMIIGSDLKKLIAVMSSDGVVQDIVELPNWAFNSTEDDMMTAFYEEVDSMPGADFKNKIWNMQHSTYTPEQMTNMVKRLTAIALTTPEAIVLKYIPDLSIDDSMLEQFKM